eukprot:6740247-Pyramimonas_sp.AAC.2
MPSPKHMLTLWIHEMMRVFQDRLCVTKDKEWFQVGLPTSSVSTPLRRSSIRRVAQSAAYLSDPIRRRNCLQKDRLNEKLHMHCQLEYNDIVSTQHLIFADFLHPLDRRWAPPPLVRAAQCTSYAVQGAPTHVRLPPSYAERVIWRGGGHGDRYVQVTDTMSMVRVMGEMLDDYNSTAGAPMKLTMFVDAIEHVSRISRVIRLPLGNALLLGTGGSGRQSLTKLAVYIEEQDIFTIENSKVRGLLLSCWHASATRGDACVAPPPGGVDGCWFYFTYRRLDHRTELRCYCRAGLLTAGLHGATAPSGVHVPRLAGGPEARAFPHRPGLEGHHLPLRGHADPHGGVPGGPEQPAEHGRSAQPLHIG